MVPWCEKHRQLEIAILHTNLYAFPVRNVSTVNLEVYKEIIWPLADDFLQ